VENASKALIMAGSILIGVLILSVFVYMFNTMGQYAAAAEERRAKTQVDMFNANFTKYIGQVTYVNADGSLDIKDVTCTMHDVISVANLAKQSNESRGLLDKQDAEDNSYYVQVDFNITGFPRSTGKNLEHYINDQFVELLESEEYMYVKNLDAFGNLIGYDLRQYKCELGYAEGNGRVNYVKFTKYP